MRPNDYLPDEVPGGGHHPGRSDSTHEPTRRRHPAERARSFGSATARGPSLPLLLRGGFALGGDMLDLGYLEDGLATRVSFCRACQSYLVVGGMFFQV